MSAQVANMDANKHVTAIKPVYFEPRLPLPGGFSYVCMILTPKEEVPGHIAKQAVASSGTRRLTAQPAGT